MRQLKCLLQSPFYIDFREIWVNRRNIYAGILLSFFEYLVNPWCSLWNITWAPNLVNSTEVLPTGKTSLLISYCTDVDHSPQPVFTRSNSIIETPK